MTPLETWRRLSPSQRDTLADLCLRDAGVTEDDERRLCLRRSPASRTMALRAMARLGLVAQAIDFGPIAVTVAGLAAYRAGTERADERARERKESR